MALATSPVALALQAQQTGRRRRLRRPPPWLHPRQIERSFAAELQRLAQAFIRQVRETVIPALPAIGAQARLEQGRADSTRADAWFDRVAPLLNALQIGATERDATVNATAIDIGQKTSEWNSKEWQKILRRTVGVGLVTAEPGLRDQLRLFVQTNANLITKLQADKIAEIQGVIERGFAQGLRHTEVAKQVMEKAETTVSRARLIARDQVSKLNGRLTQMRQQEAGIEKYIWQTAEDTRVRATHEPMDGKLGRWDDPTLYANVSEPDKWLAKSGINAVELHPGQDILCRCFAEPFIRELAEEQEAA
jgi:SPP1 gp7 family putative phage head morphogenesis protein